MRATLWATAVAVLVTLAAGISGAGAEVAPAVEAEPLIDALISKNDVTYVGEDTYNTTGFGQKVSRTGRRGTTVRFYVRVQNDGDEVHEPRLLGCPIGSIQANSPDFGVDYFLVGPGHEPLRITTQVQMGVARLRLDPAEFETVRVDVRVKSTARVGATLRCRIPVDGGGAALPPYDAVKLIVHRA
ncbi:MAG: hypothetical protein JNK12_17280 [Acidimicrobiales bacterium]|nr:hypothetical protein [Acidimicrobiales bacterium]